MLKRFVLYVLALSAVGVALLVGVAYEPDRPLESLQARWAPAPSRFLEVDGLRVHLRDEGPRDDALPLVLIHGTSASLHTWEGWAGALRGQRRVIRFDLPGIGLSDSWPPQTADYSGESYARFALKVLNALGVQQAVVGGNSLGGEVAWRMAVAAPQTVKSLILVDSAGPIFVPKSVPLGFQLARTPALNWVTQHLLTRSLVHASVANVYANPKRVTPELVDRYFELSLRQGNRQALTRRLQTFVPGRGVEALSTLKQPTLIIWGGQDRLIPPEVAQIFVKSIPHSQLVMHDDLGHVPQEEDPQATVRDVLAFLTTLATPPSAAVPP